MGHAVVDFSSKSVRVSSVARLSTKNAWAKYVRNRWPNNALKGAMAEWNLTEGQARGVVYAQISQSTIDVILEREDLRRPAGGFALGLVILAIKTATSLENYIAAEAEEARLDAIKSAARQQHIAVLEAALAGRCRVAGLGSDADWNSRAGDEALGSPRDGETVKPRAFARQTDDRRT